MKTKIQLRELTDPERQELQQLAGSRTAEARLVERARIILAAAEGKRPSAIAENSGSLGPPSATGSPASTSRAPPRCPTSPDPAAPPPTRPSRSPRSSPPR